MKNKTVTYHHWGLIGYKEAWEKQEQIFKQTLDVKVANRDLQEEKQIPTPNHIIVCEHPHVYTLGKSGKPENLLANESQLKLSNAEYFEINRGGDITYHGPGQLVVYPILDLDNFFTDIHKYLRFLEEAVIRTLAHYGVKGERFDGYTGVWIGMDSPNQRKICAMGVRASRWVTMHGLALNINTDLSYFNQIVPCGIHDKAVTSLSNEIGKKIPLEEVSNILLDEIEKIFEMRIVK